MHRREVLSLLGGVGAGLTLAGATPTSGDDHAHAKAAAKMTGPVDALHAHFCGIHVAKSDPKFQLIAQHYCSARDGDMHQCLIYDSCEKNARLLGVEYIISDKAYRRLPSTEQKYWHPHTYEVLAGGLIAPGMKPEDEMKFMKAVLTTWGKTWHTWPDPKTPVPMGEPLLMWALTGDGQEDKRVIAERDRQFGVSAAEIRQRRGKAIGYEVPQVSFPKSIDQLGRQWTDNGEDQPTSKRDASE
jgi:hypothetical protein